MKTKLRRIDMSKPENADLEKVLDRFCRLMHTDDFSLVSTFVLGTELVLVFQKQDAVP